MAKKMHEDQSLSPQEVCSTLKISRATYYRYLALWRCSIYRDVGLCLEGVAEQWGSAITEIAAPIESLGAVEMRVQRAVIPQESEGLSGVFIMLAHERIKLFGSLRFDHLG
jgi:hypothetical protein